LKNLLDLKDHICKRRGAYILKNYHDGYKYSGAYHLMKLSDFDYHLPPERIAQTPAPKREESRMMVVSRKDSALHHQRFFNIADWLDSGDTIVLNDSKVIPARLYGKKETGSAIEVLLLSPLKGASQDCPLWEALLRPGKRIRPGTLISFAENGEGKVLDRLSDKKWLIEFKTDTPFDTFLHRFGRMPLPPYIDRKGMEAAHNEDQNRYQTVYAHHPGSVAAPTAGLHFTPDIMEQLQKMGVNIVKITLHVGYGTFVPIEAENVEDHKMDEEYFEISPEAARIISASPRVIAVGTTSTRVLESVADEKGRISAQAGRTKLFIYPGYTFKRVNALLTNFHLPKSSLYLLASAFGGTDLIRKAYGEAIEEQYRFYSYGDCMLIT